MTNGMPIAQALTSARHCSSISLSGTPITTVKRTPLDSAARGITRHGCPSDPVTVRTPAAGC
jgi:hypothetical protein